VSGVVGLVNVVVVCVVAGIDIVDGVGDVTVVGTAAADGDVIGDHVAGCGMYEGVGAAGVGMVGVDDGEVAGVVVVNVIADDSVIGATRVVGVDVDNVAGVE